MNSYKISISNYRSIPSDKPLKLVLKEGISFILGVNNVGKTNLLKFFYEFRQAWVTLGQTQKKLQTHIAVPFEQLVHRESIDLPIVCNIESDSLKASLQLTPLPGQPQNCRIDVTSSAAGNVVAAFEPLKQLLSNTLYVPPLRTLSKQTSGQLCDMIVGVNFIHTWDEWANGENVRQRGLMNSLKNELRELFSFKSFDIQVSQGNDSLLISNDDGMFKLDELGDGISHFIVVLGNPSRTCHQSFPHSQRASHSTRSD